MQAEWPRWLVEVGCLTGSPNGLHVCALGCTGCVVPGEGPGQLGRLWICTLKGVELFGGEGIQAGMAAAGCACDTASVHTAHTDSVSLAYQRVQKLDCTSLRPVLILGPLLDVVREMLVNEAPGKFCRCPLGNVSLPTRTPSTVCGSHLCHSPSPAMSQSEPQWVWLRTSSTASSVCPQR